MRKIFLSNLLLLITINLLVKPLYIFGIDRGVQNAVGPDDYGFYFALFNLTYLFQIVHDLGMQNFNLVHFSKMPQAQAKYLPRMLGAKGLLAVLYLAVVLVVALLLGYRPALPLVAVLAFNHLLASLAMLFRTSLSAHGYYRLDSLLSVLDKVIMILIVGTLLWLTTRQMHIEWFVYAQTISFFLTLLVGAALLISKTRLNLFRLRVDRQFTRWLFRKTLPYALVLLLMTLYTRMDVVMLHQMLPDGDYQAGIYAGGYRILDAANMIGVLFAGLLLPMFSRLLKQGEGSGDLALQAFRLIWTIAIGVAVVSWYYAAPIIDLLYHAADQQWHRLFQMLMLSYLATSTAYIYGTWLTAGEKLTSLNSLFMVGVIVNFILNILLIPKYAAWGSALATVVTQSLVALGMIFLCRKHFALHSWQKFLGPVLYALALSVAGWGSTQIGIDWKLAVPGLAMIGLLLAQLAGLVNFRDLSQLRLSD